MPDHAGDQAAPRNGTNDTNGTTTDADVIVVGAGPAGSSTAYHLAQAGVDVLLLEKSAFPRNKICGDGLTPRAVRQLVRMGIDPRPEDGWQRNRGLRVLGGGMRLELPWPDLATYPSYGLVRKRTELDEILVRHAQKAGARLHERTNVAGPVIEERTGRIVGVTAKPIAERGRPTGAEQTYRAPLVVAADGMSSRLATAMGVTRRTDRPMGVAYRTYFTTPRHDDEWMESWLELTDGRYQLPGYGWIFACGDGTSNVGLGVLNSAATFQSINYPDLLYRWVGGMPAAWGFTRENQVGPIRGSGLPMGFNRQPHYSNGLLLVGDAGGMVNPFNGEGIDYGLEAGEVLADVVLAARAARTPAERERTLQGYPAQLKAQYGGYFTLGRVFVTLIGNPSIMKLCTRHGMPHPVFMRFVFKLLANLTDPHDGDAMDRIINACTKLAPAA
jgi:menaquinone-9 beta-reductase